MPIMPCISDRPLRGHAACSRSQRWLPLITLPKPVYAKQATRVVRALLRQLLKIGLDRLVHRKMKVKLRCITPCSTYDFNLVTRSHQLRAKQNSTLEGWLNQISLLWLGLSYLLEAIMISLSPAGKEIKEAHRKSASHNLILYCRWNNTVQPLTTTRWQKKKRRGPEDRSKVAGGQSIINFRVTLAARLRLDQPFLSSKVSPKVYLRPHYRYPRFWIYRTGNEWVRKPSVSLSEREKKDLSKRTRAASVTRKLIMFCLFPSLLLSSFVTPLWLALALRWYFRGREEFSVRLFCHVPTPRANNVSQ